MTKTRLDQILENIILSHLTEAYEQYKYTESYLEIYSAIPHRAYELTGTALTETGRRRKAAQ